MAKVIVGMTTSIDGFVADKRGSVDRLYSDLASLQGSPFMNSLIEETGAVLMGRRTFAMGDADWYAGNYEFQVPIFVVTHEPPPVHPKENERLTFTFVTDGLESALAQAKAAAGDRAVQFVGGAEVAEQLLRAGLIDELRVDVMPVLLGDGLRFFGNADLADIQLETLGVQKVGERSCLRFRVRN